MMFYTRLKNRQRRSKAALTALILIAGILKINAQAPGYQGQRITIGGYIGFAPSLFNYNANMKQGFTSFNFKKSIEGEYMASRRVGIGLHYDFMNVGVAMPYDDNNVLPGLKPDEDENYQLIVSRAPGIQIKLFKTDKGAIAPLGNYFAWNLSLVKYTVWNLKKDDYSTLTRQVYESEGSKFMLGMEWGTQRVFFNRLVFRSGFQMSLLTGFGKQTPEKEYLREQRIAYAASINIGLSLLVPYRQKVN